MVSQRAVPQKCVSIFIWFFVFVFEHRVMAVGRFKAAYIDIFCLQSPIEVIVFAAPAMKLYEEKETKQLK